MEPETGQSSGEETFFVLFLSHGNLYYRGCVKGYPHRVEGECDTRAFLRPSSLMCLSFDNYFSDFSHKKQRLSRDRFLFVSFISLCTHWLRVCINRCNLIAYISRGNFIYFFDLEPFAFLDII